MSDILIRDVPDDVVVAIDARAARCGLSRSEYLRRRLHEVAVRSDAPVTVDDLRQLASVFSDLADPEVMARAWE